MVRRMQLRVEIILLIAGLIFLCIQPISAQLEGSNWYFGRNSGIRFQGDSVVVLTDGQLQGIEGCATISDENGNLLFYTDGNDIWNRNHQVMLNGGGITNFISNTQVIIAPLPGSDSVFYVFTTMDLLPGPSMGFGYHIVDLQGDNGLGEVISRGNTLFSASSERVCMTRAANGSDLWILGHESLNNAFRAYRLSCGGLDTNSVITNVGFMDVSGYGYLKFSHDGTKVVMVESFGDSIMILDFDRSTGILANPIIFNFADPYGAEFSPDNTILYVSRYWPPFGLFQFDLSSEIDSIIDNSKISFPLDPLTIPSAIQLGINGKIYVGNAGSDFLSIIESPDSAYPSCQFVEEGIFYSPEGPSTAGWMGLPHIYPPPLKSILEYQTSSTSYCEGDTFDFFVSNFVPPDSVNWAFFTPNGDSLGGTGDSIRIHLTERGEFLLRVETYWGCVTDTHKVSISALGLPTLDLPDTIFQCGNETILITPTQLDGAESLQWSNLDTLPQISVSMPGNYRLEATNVCGMVNDSTEVLQDDTEGVFIPNVFTPNGDGINDRYEVTVKNPENYRLTLFDRWGQRIFLSNDPGYTWDGDNFSAGTYFYILQALNCKGEINMFKGWFSLIK